MLHQIQLLQTLTPRDIKWTWFMNKLQNIQTKFRPSIAYSACSLNHHQMILHLTTIPFPKNPTNSATRPLMPNNTRIVASLILWLFRNDNFPHGSVRLPYRTPGETSLTECSLMINLPNFRENILRNSFFIE